MHSILATYTLPSEAHIVLGRLQAEGLRAFVADEYLISLDWMYSQALGGVKVWIHHDDVAAARALLAQFTAGDFVADVDVDAGVPHCDGCGGAGTQSESVPMKRTLSVVAFFIFAIIFPVRGKRRCSHCDT